MELAPKNATSSAIIRTFIDPWVAMVAFGSFGHTMNIPTLYHIGYWAWVILVIGIQALWGTDPRWYEVKLNYGKSKQSKETK